MSSFESRFERLELKYLIDEATAALVCRDIAPFCRPDVHNPAPTAGGPRGYRLSSLYLDSPGLAFYHAKERGDPERLKLRIRTYEGSPQAVVEMKRRVADVIDKTRASIDRKDVEGVVNGSSPIFHGNHEMERFLSAFSATVARTGAQPTLMVRYEREAWASFVDHYARITFDRNIEAHRTASWGLDEEPERWWQFDDHWRREESERSVVLEIKCQSLIPWWVTDLIRSHGLARQSFSKYSIGIYLTGLGLGEDRVNRRSARWMQ